MPVHVVDVSFANAEPFVLNPARRTVLVVHRDAKVARRVRGADDVLEMPHADDDGAELRARLLAKLERPCARAAR